MMLHTICGQTRSIIPTSFFSFPSQAANPHLATASMSFAAAGIASQDALNDRIAVNQPNNAKEFLTKLGFDNFDANAEFVNWPDENANSFGVCGAEKQITSNGSDYTLFAFVPRNANYAAEWAGNLIVGSGEDSPEPEGFAFARGRFIDFVKSHIGDFYKNNPTAPKNIKIWAVGYSRGAAAVNISMPYFYDNKNELLPEGVSVKPDDIFTYTFGTPQGAWAGQNGENKEKLASYTFVHNYYSNYDAITMVAFENFGFGRYGVDHALNVGFNNEIKKDDPDNKALMLSFLRPINSVLYDRYTAEYDSYDPDKYMICKFMNDGSMNIEPDSENVSGLPTDPEGLFRERFAAVSALTKDRVNYTENYQPALTVLAKYFKGDYSSRPSMLINNFMSGDQVKTVGAAALAYYASSRFNTAWNNSDVAQREHYRSQFNALVELVFSMTDSYIDIENIGLNKEEYASIRGSLMELVSDPQTVINDETVGMLRKLAGSMFAQALADAAEKTGYSAEEIAELAGENNSNGAPLVDVLTAILFDRENTGFELMKLNEDTGEYEFNWQCDQLCLLATLMGNGSQLTTHTHANEILKSWLMVSDSYYNDDYNFGAYRTFCMKLPNDIVNVKITDKNGAAIDLVCNRNTLDRTDAESGINFDVLTNIKYGMLTVTLPFGSSYKISVSTDSGFTTSAYVSEYKMDGEFSSKITKGASGRSFENVLVGKDEPIVFTLSDRTDKRILGTAVYDIAGSDDQSAQIKSPKTGYNEITDIMMIGAVTLSLLIILACISIKSKYV